jgi:hypothetical protein
MRRTRPIPRQAGADRVPPIASQLSELVRVVSEYAEDAITLLEALRAAFTDADGGWVREHAAPRRDSSLAQLERDGGTARNGAGLPGEVDR